MVSNFKNNIKSIFSYLKRPHVQKIILIFLATRIVLTIYGIHIRETSASFVRMYDDKEEIRRFGYIGTIFHGWDSGWYLRVSHEGYKKIDVSELPKTETALAFFPFYPILIRTLGSLMGHVSAGILISNISLLLSGVFLYELVKLKHGSDLAYKSAKFLFLFPTSFILSAIQSESLFLCLFLLAFLLLERKKYLASGLVGFFLSITRPIGFVIAISIALSAVINKAKEYSKKKVTIYASAIFPIFGIILFALYQYTRTGGLNTIYLAGHAWGRNFNFNPLYLISLITSNLNGIYLVGIVMGGILLLYAIYGLKILDVRYVAAVSAIVVLFLLTTRHREHLLSIPRYFSVLFPAYIGMARMGKLSKFLDISSSFAFFVFQLALFNFWTRGFPTPM